MNEQVLFSVIGDGIKHILDNSVTLTIRIASVEIQHPYFRIRPTKRYVLLSIDDRCSWVTGAIDIEKENATS